MANVVGSNLKVPKAMTLKELSLGSAQPTIQDFAPSIEASAPVVNPPSSINSAAYAAALSPEGTSADAMIDGYRQALAESSLEGQSQTATGLFKQAQQNAIRQNVDPLMDILANPNITDEQKQKAVGAVYDVNSAIYSPSNIVSTKALSTAPLTTPNAEQDKTRFDISAITTELNAAKAGVQSVYNSAMSQSQPDLRQHITDFAIGVLPFTRQYMVSKIAADQTDAPVKAFLSTFIGGIGSQTQYLKQQIDSLPPDQQIGAAQNMADIINKHSNILINTPDDEVRRQVLQGVLGGEGYSGKQELVDNLSSWADLIFSGGAALKGASTFAGKFGAAIRKGASQAETEAAFKADFEANYAAEKAATKDTARLKATDGSVVDEKDIVPDPGYSPTNKNSLGQFYRSREVQVYDSSSGVPYQKMPPENILSNAIRDAVRSQVQPVSLFQNFKDTNVDMARNSFESMTLDQSGEAARAYTGTDRTDAIASAMMPEVAHIDGSVANKVAAVDAIAQTRDAIPADLADFIKHDGLTQYLQSEKAAARAWKVNQFQEAVGMTAREEMFQFLPDMSKFTDTPQGFSFRGVYGPQNNGFSNAQDALETARFALRNTGIDEAKLSLLRRQGGSYVPTTLEEVMASKRLAEAKFEPATSTSGTVEATAKSSKGTEFNLKDSPTSMDTSGYGLKEGQWIREVIATTPSGEEMGRLIYTNYNKPPSIRVNPEYQRQGVATGMLKLAKQRGGTLGEDATGKFANGETATRTDEGQAFRSGNNPDDVFLSKPGQGYGQDDYLVAVDHDYKIQAQDVTEAKGWSALKVNLNFFDRWVPLGGTQGTFSNIILDPQSMLDKVIVAPAVVGVDRAAAVERSLLRQIGDFATTWKKLDKVEQALGQHEIQDANLLSRDYDYTTLAAGGASPELMDALRKFKAHQDTIWHLRNHYFAVQLDKAGYEEFVHAATNTNLPVRKVAKSSVAGGVNVWDAATDTIVNVDSASVANLYQNGGGIAKLRTPVLTQGGQAGEYVVHTNSAATGYTRKFTPTSQVLAYRPGYYAVDYKDDFHIIEKVKDANGKVIYEHSVATAKDTKGAATVTNRMNAQGPNEFYYRKDTRLNDDQRFDSEFDVNQAQGMSAFRRRGKLLEDSTSQVTNLGNSHVRNPVETMVRNARSISKKVAMADVIDAIKQRGIAQYSDVLPKGDYNQPLIPTDMRQIKYRGGVNQSQSHVADARTTFGYANYLENGYVNLLDDSAKALLNNVADLLGQVSGTAESAARTVARHSPTNLIKSVSYYAFLGLAPLRQLVVQGHQAVMLAALNPSWVASPKAFSQPAYLAMRSMGMDANHGVARTLATNAWGDSATAERVFKQFQRTGLGAAIDHQNMISGAVNDMAANMVANASNSLVSKATYVPRTVAAFSRKIGFDAGEFYSSSMSWLAHRDLAQKGGLDPFNDEVADKIAGAARNYTGNMNSAGDLASNKNALAMVFQFTQNPQKMLLNISTNRAIPWELKAKMALLGLVLFGTGTRIFLDSKTLNSIKDPNAREVVMNGVEGWALNKMFSLASGQKSEIDWNGLSPFNAYGTLDLIHTLFTTNIGDVIANSPSLSMLFGNNPRVATAVQDFAKYTNLVDDYQNPTDFLTVAHDFAKISSGYSAGYKAWYLLKTKQKVSGAGTVTQDHVDQINAIGTLLGFPTEQETTMQYLTTKVLNDKKELEANFNKFYKDLKAHYSNPDLKGNDLVHTQKMLTEFYRVYGNNNPFLQDLMNKKLRADLRAGDASMYNLALRNCSLYNKGDCLNLIDGIPFDDPQQKENLKQLLIFGNQFQDKPYDGKDN